MTRYRVTMVLAALALFAVASVVWAMLVGSVDLPLSGVPRAVLDAVGSRPTTLGATLLQLRLDRALAAFSVGAMLALAGAMMQALLRNPLADPYVLGVSGGAAAAALGAMLVAGAAWIGDAAAFGGALAVALLLFVLARRDLRGSGEGGTPVLLLTGVVIGSGCAALVALMLALAPDNRLRGMVFWLLGDLSAARNRPWPWLILLAALAFALRSARALNVMALHADAAAAFGVRVDRLRQGLFVCAALLTAGAVSSAGSIGFVGLVVPHACRLAWGADHRLLLPASALSGGSFLVLADTLARSIVAPQQLPVGVITALVGVPVFLLQLHHVGRR